MLAVKDLHAYYGRAHILHGVTLEAAAMGAAGSVGIGSSASGSSTGVPKWAMVISR
jgi:ABC-type histidine transport system ATPase subunit